MAHRPSIIQFVTDPLWLGLALSPAQRTLLKSVYGLPLAKQEMVLFQTCTGRETYVRRNYREITCVAGARSGKDSRLATPIALYEAVFGHHHVDDGHQIPTVAIIAQDAVAARDVALKYVKQYVKGCAALASLVADDLADRLRFTNGVELVAFPSTEAAAQGRRILVAICDEIAYWPTQGKQNSDFEIQASLRRGMVGQHSRTRLIKITTPRGKVGAAWQDSLEVFGIDDEFRLYWTAPTQLMNPTITKEELREEERKDPARFRRYFLGQFADPEDSFLQSAWIQRAVAAGRTDPLPFNPAWRYSAGVDFSGGASDSTALCIAHKEQWEGSPETVVMDAAMVFTPRRGELWDLEGLVTAMSRMLRSYGCHQVHGDQYAGRIIASAFAKAGITYKNPESRIFVPARDGWSQGRWETKVLHRSDVYNMLLPWISSGCIKIHDHAKLIRELETLQRTGDEKVDHIPGMHDDLANALAIAVAMLSTTKVVPRAGRGHPDPVPTRIASIGTPTGSSGSGRPWARSVHASGFRTARYR